MTTSISTRDVIGWLYQFLANYKTRVIGAVIALFVAATAWLALGQGIKYAVDNGFAADNMATLNTALVGVLLLCLVASIATYFRFYLMTWLGERVSADIRQSVYNHLLDLSPSFFSTLRTGEVISRFTSDTTVLQTVIGMSLSMTIRSLITFVGSLVLMGFSSPILTLCVLLAVPFVLIPIRVLAPKVRRYAKLSQDKVADLGAHIDETLHEIHTVQAFVSEAREKQHFGSRVESAMDMARKRMRYRALLICAIMLLSMSAIIFIAWVGARQVFSGELSVGELSAFLFYAVMAGGSIATISEVIGEVQRGVGASERLIELLRAEPSVYSGEKVLPTSHTPPQICFNQVAFSYPEASPLFQALDLTITPGEKLALVGASGAGKSTLFQLLMRFYDVSKGSITINGHAIDELTLDSLRKSIAMVSQEPVVFADTVMENIRYGRPDASDLDVVTAAKAAHADEFIQQLSDGYNSELGERGVKLSGGQRQRIAIARAILADRPILLLDEATSALDAVSETKVQQALDKLMENRTTIVIAHRLATVQHVDRIVVMEHGKIVGQGTHKELMKTDTIYREYAELQLMA